MKCMQSHKKDDYNSSTDVLQISETNIQHFQGLIALTNGQNNSHDFPHYAFVSFCHKHIEVN
jgi:hypothetical protein